MPVMPRADKKAQRIAFNILGIPANMQKSKKRDYKYKEPSVGSRRYDELVRISQEKVPTY